MHRLKVIIIMMITMAKIGKADLIRVYIWRE